MNNSEKIIVTMLADLLKASGARSELNLDLLSAAISDDHLWGLAWEHSWLDKDEWRQPEIVTEVLKILDMCLRLKLSIQKLPEAERTSFTDDQNVFFGFDGNNEPEHFSVVKFIVDKLGRYPELSKVELNSHTASLDKYEKMLGVYIQMSTPSDKEFLSLDEINKVLAA